MHSKPDIIAILDREGITLQGNFTKCVFHDEKTASLRIYPGNNSYYCYGCGAGGDSISFIMRYKDLPYKNALKYLDVKPPILIRRDIQGRNAIQQYKDWQRTYHQELCHQYRAIQNHKCLVKNIDDINPESYHAEPKIIHHLDILDSGGPAMLTLYKGVKCSMKT